MAVVISMTLVVGYCWSVRKLARMSRPALTDQILAARCPRHQRPGLALTPGARQAIAAYPWPGNVRELINALERAVVLTGGDALTANELPDQVAAPVAGLPAPSIAKAQGSLRDLERAHVQRVLAETATLEEAATSAGSEGSPIAA